MASQTLKLFGRCVKHWSEHIEGCNFENLGHSVRFRRQYEANRDQVRKTNLHHAERCQRFLLGRDEELVRSLADRLQLRETAWRPKIRMEGGELVAGTLRSGQTDGTGRAR